MSGAGWTDGELEACVVAYKEMLDDEAAGISYVRSDVRDRVLTTTLTTRNKKAYEFRMQNISAVLDEMGMGWIEGYKPARNVGSNIKPRIARLIDRHW